MKFYGYNKCGTCRKAKKFLDESGVSYQDIDITITPPPKTVLKKAIQQKGLGKLFNTSGVLYREMNMKDKVKTMSEKDAVDLLASEGKLIKRPIVVDGDTITVGFDEKEFSATWK